MLRMIYVTLLGLSVVVLARSDDPKPQWQRLLTGDDAKQAAELEKRIGQLEAADKYAEAIRLQEELLALRTKVQGADHWESVNEKWILMALKKVAALPEEKRTGWRKAARGQVEAERLVQKAQYAAAMPLLEERLTWCRQVLGEDHPATGGGYNKVAGNLNAQGKYAEAGPLYQKALDICRKVLGEGHPDTATSYDTVALILNAQGKYAEAGLLLRKALDIRRKALGEEHPSTAQSYNAIAVVLSHQGRYAEAGPLLQKALDIWRKVHGEDHPDIAQIYNNVAANLAAQEKYAEAGPLFQKALDIWRKVHGEDHPRTAMGYNNVAFNLNGQGKYAEAGPLLQKALDIWRKVHGEDHADTATGYNHVAFNLKAQGKYGEAGPLYQKALDIRRKVLGDDHPDTARSYCNVAFNLKAQGKYAEAGPLFQKDLDICRKVLGENHPDTTQSYTNVALILNAQGKYAEAMASLERSARSYESARLGVAAGGLERAAFGAKLSPYDFLAATRSRAGRIIDAWAALEADLGRGLLDEIAARRGIGLTPAEQRQRDDLRTQRTNLEARILPLVTRPKRTDVESAELERLLGERRKMEQALDELAVAVSSRELTTLDKFRAALPADAAFIAWVDVDDVYDKASGVQEHWGCVVRAKEDPHWERLPGSGADGKWTKDDIYLPYQFRQALAHWAPASKIEELAKKLNAQRLVPLSKHLAGVQRLIIAPVAVMSRIPIEVLTEQYTVSYTPSGTHLARLKDRKRPGSFGLLAVGDPLFPPHKETPPLAALPPGGLLITQVAPGSTAAKARLRSGDVLIAYAGEDLTSVEQLGKLIKEHTGDKSVLAKIWREDQDKVAERELGPGRLGVLLAKEPAREARARRRADQLLAKLTRGDDYAELPGTQVEIARLAGLFDGKAVTTLTRSEASEERLEALRAAGELKQFRYLHFATHGKANNVRSFDSALILTRPNELPLPRPGEPYLEGRLTAGEVLEYWKLDAELVTLSACESGLGRQGGGDGLLGFAQAFLLAGSRSVCLTLWQVDDTATVLLMDRFYRNLLGKREDGAPAMGKAMALREAKEWLRNLSASEALERLATLTGGMVRGQQPVREEMKPVPQPKDAAKDHKPYAHPHYWAAFILIGDPD